jgi:hypothetical protein
MLGSTRRAVHVHPLLPCVGCQLPLFTAAALPLLPDGLLERVPEVRQRLLNGGPVAKDLEERGIHQCLGLRSVEPGARAQEGPTLGGLGDCKPFEPRFG